jgi:WD40 repeat protein
MLEHAAPADHRSGSLFNPFPGLRAFEPDEDYLYFGRERQIDELLHRLGEARLLAVVGTSGSGKSSLVRAGLVPALYSGFMTRAGSSWRVAILRPGGDPIGNLAAALDDPAVLGQGEELGEAGRMILESTLRASSLGLADCVRQSAIPAADNVLVVVDQFEELFRFKHVARASRDEAVAFVKLLLAAAASDVPVYVVLTMRSEFIGDCMDFPGFPEAINRGQYLVPRMTRDELRLAITGPVGVRGARISPRLVARLLNDVGDDQDQLPVLQHALMRMWSRWEPTRVEGAILDLDEYEAIGTLSEALSRHAESTFQELSAHAKEIAERLFKALTDTDREGRAVRRPVQVKEICALTGADEAAVVGVIERFRLPGRSFLMPLPAVALDGDSVVDLSHESLMRQWVRLKRWGQEEAESAAVYRRLSQAAALARKGEGGLWRSPELDIGLRWRERERPTAAWARRYDPEFPQAMAFLDRSRRRLLARWLALSLAALALAAVALTYFYLQGRIAKEQARLRAVLSAPDPLVRALLLAELEELQDVDWGLGFAQQVASAAIPKAVLRRGDEALLGVAFSADDKQVATVSAQGAVDWWSSDGRGEPRRGVPVRAPSSGGPSPELTAVAFSGDGRSLAAGFADGTLLFRSSDAAEGGGRVQRIKGRTAPIRSLAFSPDGRRIVAGAEDSQVEIWSPGGGGIEPLGTPEERHKAPVYGAAFAADGETVVTAYLDGTARIWDLRAGGPPTVLRGAKGSEFFQSAAFSPDGKWVICASSDGSVLIWSRDGSGGPIELAGHDEGNPARYASFAPGGLKVVAAFDDRTARVWALRPTPEGRLEAAGAPMILGGHTRPVTAAVFSHSGNEIATISKDGTARIWPSEPGEPRILGRHAKAVESVAFSADATRVVSASRDGSARVWALGGAASPIVLDGKQGHSDWVRTAAFSPSGTHVLTASEDGTYRLWDLARGTVRRFRERAPVLSAAFDPAGARVVTAMKDSAARIWALHEARDPTLEAELAGPTGHTDRVWSAAFSADGTRVVTASGDRTARVWDLLRAGHPPDVLKGHGDQVRKAAFSPDGGRVVTASFDGTARVWTLDGTAKPIVLRHEDNKVNDAAFSANGRWVVTASADRTARVWSADQGGELMALRHPGPVQSAAFGPGPAGDREDPAYVVTGSEDGTVRIWRISLSALIDYARDATTACLTVDQRVRFLGESEAQAHLRAAQCEQRYGREPREE